MLPECRGGRPMGFWPLVRAERTFLVPSGPGSLISTVSLPVGSIFPADRALSRPLPPLLVEADLKNGQTFRSSPLVSLFAGEEIEGLRRWGFERSVSQDTQNSPGGRWDHGAMTPRLRHVLGQRFGVRGVPGVAGGTDTRQILKAQSPRRCVPGRLPGDAYAAGSRLAWREARECGLCSVHSRGDRTGSFKAKPRQSPLCPRRLSRLLPGTARHG